MKSNGSKYKLIVNHVTAAIDKGELMEGDRIPSINHFRDMYKLSRDTVFTGLSELKSRGIIEPVQGVGYFVSSTNVITRYNIFLLFNELNEFKEDLYNSFIETVGDSATVELFFHNYNRRVFETLLKEANNKYTTFIIMSGKFEGILPLLQSLSGRVFLLDHFHPELRGIYSSVAQNFEKDTYEALVSGLTNIRKYKRICMVQKDEKEPQERYDGLRLFGDSYGFGHEYTGLVKGRQIQPGDLYMVVNDRDLVDILKKADTQKLKPGKDFGIISYNDTPLKEILAGGITTLSTDFKLMGRTMAGLIDRKEVVTIENPWRLNIRKSL